MNYLDLFSGIGGFALGAYNAGCRFDRHYFSEIDPWCCELYARRFPDAVPLGDIREIDGKALVAESTSQRHPFGANDQRAWPAREQERNMGSESIGRGWIITGGFPCQDISVAGKGAGIEGLRSGLWFEYARLIGEIRPSYAIMENVGALTRRGLDRVLGSLSEIGYDAEWSDIRASDVGAPHRRERIWIVAYPEECGRYWNSERSCTAEGFTGRRETLADAECYDVERNGTGGIQESTVRRRVSTPERGFQAFREWEQWAVEPDVGRVAHGIPRRVDRLRGLGNAIVPQIAEMIFRGLL
jgi:DNA (cytosine-5)-methyltransferase 1